MEQYYRDCDYLREEKYDSCVLCYRYETCKKNIEKVAISQNPCEQCVYQNQSWNSEPCYKCGAENDYAYCQDSDGNLIDTSSENKP